VVSTVDGATTTAALTGLAPALAYQLRVEAVDATGNRTGGPAVTATTTGTKDGRGTGAAGRPDGHRTGHLGGYHLGTGALAASTDNYGVDHYTVSLNGKAVGTSTTSLYTLTGLIAGTTYAVTVSAVDATGNVTGVPAPGPVTTAAPYDRGVPVFPHGAQLRARSGGNSVTLSWPAGSASFASPGYGSTWTGSRSGLDSPRSHGGDHDRDVVHGDRPVAGNHTITVQAGDKAGRWTGRG